jgi:hypothetical protein
MKNSSPIVVTLSVVLPLPALRVGLTRRDGFIALFVWHNWPDPNIFWSTAHNLQIIPNFAGKTLENPSKLRRRDNATRALAPQEIIGDGSVDLVRFSGFVALKNGGVLPTFVWHIWSGPNSSVLPIWSLAMISDEIRGKCFHTLIRIWCHTLVRIWRSLVLK